VRSYLFVVNPTAGKGRGARVEEWLSRKLARSDIDHHIVRTKGRGEAGGIARDAHADVVVAVGGDGTIHEIANGLIGTKKILGIIPAGSGNDLVKSLGIPQQRDEALRDLLGGSIRRFDAGRVQWSTHPDGNFKERFFVNGLGIGFDAAVAKTASELRYLSGTLLYLTAVLLTMRRYIPPLLEISLQEAGKGARRQLLVAVGNGACAGGGFYLTPTAKADDGLLDVCSIDAGSAFRILALVPKVLRGKHAGADGVTMYRGKEFTVSSDEPFPVHADGEFLGDSIRTLRVGVVAGMVPVVAPRSKGRDV